MSKLILRSKDCQGKGWRVPGDLSHLQTTVLIPLHAGELAKAVTSMPIALVRQGEKWDLVGVCGLKPKQNLLIKEGRWQGKYFPVSLFTYPFDLMSAGKVGVATFDISSGLLVTEGGEPFFDEAGQFTAPVAKRIKILREHQGRRVATERAIAALARAGILMPWPELTCEQLGMEISGLHLVDERALGALDDSTFLALRKAQALGVAYALNMSIYQARLLREKAETGEPPANTSAGAVSTTGDLDLEFLNDSETIKFGPLH